MKILLRIIVITIVLSCVVESDALEVKNEAIRKNTEGCRKFAKDPYFEMDLVVGKPWRVYHTWNIKIDTKCVDMTFRNATPAIIQRVWSDMSEYMEQQPYWDSAALLVTMGSARQEMLLFPANGEAGGFTAVPNVIRGSNDLNPMRNGVPLLKFQLKLVQQGKFLVMMDCNVGISSLAARASHTPYRSEIAAAVAELNLGDGHPACTQEKNKEEQFFVK